jgi:hypothetical protein
MKKYMFFFIVAAVLGFSSCSRLDIDDVDFALDESAYTVKAGDVLTFGIKGNPNYITFYSGEEGNAYANKDRTELSVSDVASSKLSFVLTTQYGTQTGPLKVYLSKDFAGLTKTFDTDKAAIEGHAWTDITDACGLTNIGAVTNKSISFDLKDYVSTGVVLAFRYLGVTGSTQRTMTITGTAITTTLNSGIEVSVGTASTFGFTPFDVNPSNSAKDAYLATGGVGTWSLTSIGSNKLTFQGGTAAAATNDDWLISSKITLNSCSPDTGTAVKDINNRITSYEYTYTKPGTYKATFIAGNANKDDDDYVVKEVTVTVTE